VPIIFELQRSLLGSKISGHGQLAEVAAYFAMSGLPTEVKTTCRFQSSDALKMSAAPYRLCLDNPVLGGKCSGY
jgi:hypothetical protein